MNTSENMVAQETYRHLRLMLVMLPLMLLVGSLLAFWGLGVVQGSLSAYYLSPVRDIFVGAMVGIAVCLVVYRGSSRFEDYALNVAAFYAVFVALFPTGLDQTLASLTRDERADAVTWLRLSALAVLFVTAVFLVVEWRTGLWARTAPAILQRRPTKVLFVVTNVLGLAFLILLGWRLLEGDAFGGVHLSAAVLLVASLALAVASHAWPDVLCGRGGSYRGVYKLIFFLMSLGVVPVFLVMLWLAPDYTVLAIEWYEMLLFLAFWVMETRRTWYLVPS